MRSDAQILLHHTAATRKPLRCVLGGHDNNLGASLFHFALQQVPEQSPPGIVGAQGYVMIVRHKAAGQVLDGGQGAVICEGSGDLVPDVAALVGDRLVLLCDLERCIASWLRALLLSVVATSGFHCAFPPDGASVWISSTVTPSCLKAIAIGM